MTIKFFEDIKAYYVGLIYFWDPILFVRYPQAGVWSKICILFRII